MTARPLSLVPSAVESPASRASRLMAEARDAGLEQIRALEAALATVGALSAEIADGGDVYPPGARDLARRLAEDAGFKLKTLEAILAHGR